MRLITPAIFWCLVLFQVDSVLSKHTSNHRKHDHLHLHYRDPSPSVAGVSSTRPAGSKESVDSTAGNIVSNALYALSVINPLRMQNSHANNYTNPVNKEHRSPAKPLNCTGDNISRLLGLLKEESDTKNFSLLKRKAPKDAGTETFAYTVPQYIAQAARELAESKPPSPSTGEEEALASRTRRKYGNQFNDTNRPPQKLQTLTEPFKASSDQDVQKHNGEKNKDLMSRRAESESKYWLADLKQNGASPFAPDGYKVWRNVKDYGAKGDGVTDDTAAINKAISDGGRCGANCGSSTVSPAVVFFPPGNYLVSTSIVQYYNTQFLGDPIDYPTILAAASFVGLGVITSDVYVADTEEWYLNTNNFLRSIRNFKMDITRTDPNAYVCAIHWQVAQGTTLENIEFYMSQSNGNTQQGIYMENGSGGFMGNLTFVGGNFGAYLGNQQFTTSELVFVNCKTAVQVHWDWAWTMQDVVIESCGTGVVITGGAGGPMSDGQSVGSYILVDAIIANTPTGIVTSLYGDNSTAVLLQNVGFFNVKDAIVSDTLGKPILAGGNEVIVPSWGFGLYADDDGLHFAQQQDLPKLTRKDILTGSKSYIKGTSNFFTRRRPQYFDLAGAQVFDVKAYGAKGDGVTDDTAALNSVLSYAANMSSIVYIPYGIYIIKDTLNVPVGSRIIGQVWPQIMATGSKFESVDAPHVAVRVGKEGDTGIIEIQQMMFTVSGSTAGAILMEWNVCESVQGSAGLWDSHFRVGGAKGSNLQSENCPKQSKTVNKSCIAGSLMLHVTKSASAYMENVWSWVADHDLDKTSQDQIDVYVARGILVESQGPTWLYGTSSEHSVLYQYQFSGAKNLVAGMIQTESPYFQPTPPMPDPFTPGKFVNDPKRTDSKPSFSSWAVRMIDSETVYMLGASLYSWYKSYSQDCLRTEDCQQRGFHVEQSHDIWVNNLITKAIVESLSPLGETPLWSRDLKNGYTSSLLGWFREPSSTIGKRNFTGFLLYDNRLDENRLAKLPSACRTSLTQIIDCPWEARDLLVPGWKAGYENDTLSDSVCGHECETSIISWFNQVSENCKDVDQNQNPLNLIGGTLWSQWNQTCVKDDKTMEYCGDILNHFDKSGSLSVDELCSFCSVKRYEMMQSSPYSYYGKVWQSQLKEINAKCGLDIPTEVPDPLRPVIDPYKPSSDLCASGVTYTTVKGDTCDTISLSHKVSSANLFIGNINLINCNRIPVGTNLCIPFECDRVYSIQKNDTCFSIETSQGLGWGDGTTLQRYNPWLKNRCTNLQIASENVYGHVMCLGVQDENSNTKAPDFDTTTPSYGDGYVIPIIEPPAGVEVAKGTTLECGRWYVRGKGSKDTCTKICVQNSIPWGLFLEVNPSLSADSCEENLVDGTAYCVGPGYSWDIHFEGDDFEL